MEINAPRAAFVSAKEAGRFIGISGDLFEQLADQENWMRPVWFGTGQRRLKKWPRMDVVCFEWIYHRRNPPPEA